MLSSSISAGETQPNADAFTLSRSSRSRRARSLAESFFESFTPRTECSRSTMTAAATTGPAKGPAPTSSTPPMHWYPLNRSSRSVTRIDSKRRSSWSRRCNCREIRDPSWRTPERRSLFNQGTNAGSREVIFKKLLISRTLDASRHSSDNSNFTDKSTLQTIKSLRIVPF